jgi:uncharacterized protein YlzI (FlbEa/FlbD family)
LRTQGWEVGLGAQVEASKVKKMFPVCTLQLSEDLLACKQIIAEVVVDVVVHRIQRFTRDIFSLFFRALLQVELHFY